VTPEKTPENDQPASPPDGDPPRSELPPSELPPEQPAAAEVAAAPPPSDDVAAASEEPATAPASEQAAAPPPVEEPARRAGWPAAAFVGAAVLGAAIALAVGAVASLFVLPRDNGVSALEARLGALELQLRDLAQPAPPPPPAADTRAVDEMAARIARLEAVGGERPPAAGDASLGNRLAGLEGEVKALAETIGALGRRSDEATAAAREARTRAETSAAALAALTQKVADAPAVARSELDTFDQRVAKLERNDQALAAELAKRSAAAESGDRAARLALAAATLNSAVERGEAFAAELAAAKALGADPKALAPLEPFAASGVPSADALGRELAALVPSLRPAAPAAPREGFLQRLQVNAEKLVRVNPAAEVAGDDASAVVSRVEARAAQGDLSAALAELGKLPPAARAAAEPWIKKAQARTAALEASRRLAAASLAGLGK
jgi:hypothetical protein